MITFDTVGYDKIGGLMGERKLLALDVGEGSI